MQISEGGAMKHYTYWILDSFPAVYYNNAGTIKKNFMIFTEPMSTILHVCYIQS